MWFQEDGGRRWPCISPAPSLAPGWGGPRDLTVCRAALSWWLVPWHVAFSTLGMPALCQREATGVSKACCCISPNSRPRSAFLAHTRVIWGCWGTWNRWTDPFLIHFPPSTDCVCLLPVLSYPFLSLSPFLFILALLRWEPGFQSNHQTDVSP